MNNLKKPDYCLEWFNLTNYDYLYDFHRASWGCLVFTKKMVYDSLKNGEHLLSNYNVDFMLNLALSSYKKGQQLCKDTVDDEIIHKVNFGDFILMYQDVLLSDNQKQKDFLEKLKSECLNFPYEFEDDTPQECINSVKPMDFLNFPDFDLDDNFDDDYFAIDLGYSDEAIIEAFKSKLLELRSNCNKKGKRISDSEIESLIKFRVIPYIDLMLWGMLTGNKLTDQKMADILFADDPDGKGLDTIRQTTKKKALKLLSQTRPKFI